MGRTLVIGTRGSRLALAQAEAVAGALEASGASVRIEIIRTRGDRLMEVSLQSQLDKGFFTSELESALLKGSVDLAVHSLKDLPTAQPPGLVLGAIPQRAPVGDVLLVRPEALDLGDDGPLSLPLIRGARVGTSANRRLALLTALRPDVKTGIFRGNVPTRVQRCIDGDVDAVVLARAGLQRLSLDVSPLVCFDLAPDVWLPAAGQGALGLQCREGDSEVLSCLQALHHAPSGQAASLERAMLARLEGGCHAAVGVYVEVSGPELRLHVGAAGEARGAEDRPWMRIICTGAIDDEAALIDRCAVALGASVGEAHRRCWSPAVSWGP